MNFYEKVQELQALKENEGTIVLVRCGIFFSGIGKMLTENFEFYIIQIPRGIREKIDDELVKWLKFLDNPNSMEVREMAEKKVLDKKKLI